MLFQKPTFQRAVVRHTVAKALEADQLNRDQNVGQGLLELFGNELQESEGFHVMMEIKVGEEWAKIWHRPNDSFVVVVLSDGGNEPDMEVWS